MCQSGIRRTTRFFFCACLFFLLCSCSACAQDSGVRDTIAVGCPVWANVDMSDTVRVPIFIYTDQSVNLVSFTFNYSCTNLLFVGAELNWPIICNPGIAGDILIYPLPATNTYWIYVLGGEEWGTFPPIICSAPTRRLFANLLFTVDDLDCCYPDLDTISLSEQKSTFFGRNIDYKPVFVACAGQGIAINCPVDVDLEEQIIVPKLILTQNFPNPFNSGTTIEVQIDRPGPVSITIYNILGRRVRTIVDDIVGRGTQQFAWDGTDESGKSAASGVYFARVNTPSMQITRKLVLLR